METVRIKLTPADNNHSSIVGSVELERADDLGQTIDAGGYLEVTQDNETGTWVNLAHILQVEEAPEGQDGEYAYT